MPPTASPNSLATGPIIEQDVVRVDHRHNIEDLVRLGAAVERGESHRSRGAQGPLDLNAS
jgi:formyltetrahydrofolate hydrolase